MLTVRCEKKLRLIQSPCCLNSGSGILAGALVGRLTRNHSPKSKAESLSGRGLAGIKVNILDHGISIAVMKVFFVSYLGDRHISLDTNSKSL